MKIKNKTDIIIQARMGSARLKGKVLKKYKNYTPLKILIERLKKCKKISNIIICTTKLVEDDRIVDFCKKEKIKFFRGSKNDVLSRYYYCAKKFKSSEIIRITSDCPLIDYRIINNMLKLYQTLKVDYYANTYPLPTTYPDGMDIEIFNFSTLEKTFYYAALPSEREHVTPYMYNSKKFKIKRKELKKDISKLRFCIDYQSDFNFFVKLIKYFKNRIYDISMLDLVSHVKKKPKLIYYQKKIVRNQGWYSSLKKDEKFK